MVPPANPALSAELAQQAVWVRRLVRRLVRDSASADDLAQEVALAALTRKPRSPEGPRPAGPWLARVASNLARRSWRTSALRAVAERAAAREENEPGPDETLARLEIQRGLVEELERLEEPYRGTLVRRFLDGWSAARIARETGVPAPTVRWRLQHGLAELRARLDRRSGGDGIAWRLALLPLVHATPGWPELPHPRTALLGAQGVLAMKLSTQVGLAGALVLALGIGILWQAGGGPAAPLRSSARPPDAPAELAPPAGPMVVAPAPAAQREAFTPLAPSTSHAEAAPAPPAATTRVDGRCVDHGLVPVAGARVFECSATGDPAPDGGAVRAAGDGVFVLECPPQREAKRLFRIEADGFGTRVVEVVTPRDETTHLGDLVLLPGGAVRGRVRSSSGTPVGGATLTVTGTELRDSLDSARRHGPPADPRNLRTESALDGSFRLEGVSAGMVRVWASAPGSLHAVSDALEVPAHGETAEIELVLEPLADLDRIVGVVLDPEGKPVPRASGMYMRIARFQQSQGDFAADEQGRFEFSAARDSTYDLYVGDPEERWLQIELEGVAPGTLDLELAFAESRWIDVSVRSQGEPVTEFALFALDADGGYASGHMRPEPHIGGRARLRAATKPFHVKVDAPGYALAQEGPFEPAFVPASLAIELEPELGLHGRVTFEGAPVRGARLSLHAWCLRERIDHGGYPALQAPYDLALATSGDDGSFVLSPRSAGTYVVRAEAAGYAATDCAPLEVDPAVGRTGLELALTRGGAIEGRVLMPSGRDPAGVIVAVNRGDAHPRTLRSDEEGRFRFEGLTPGRWHLGRGKLEFVEGRGSTNHAGRPPAVIPFNCVVVDGDTAHMDIDLRAMEPCVIHGELEVNGAPAVGWLLTVGPADGSPAAAPLPSTATDAAGRFTLETEDAGPARLSLRPLAEVTAQGGFSVTLELVPGGNPWKADCSLGRLEGRFAVLPAADEVLIYDAAEGVVPSCTWTITPDAEGRFALPFVPAGRGRIQRFETRDDSNAWVTLLEVEVRARETRVVEVP